MSAKDNFAQAMKELLNGENEAAEAEDKKAAPSSFSSFSQPDSRPPKAPAPEKKEDGSTLSGDTPEAEAIEEEKPVSIFAGGPRLGATETKSVEETAGEDTAAATDEPAEEPAAKEAKPVKEEPIKRTVMGAGGDRDIAASFRPATENNGQITVIAPGTVIIGDMTTAGGLRVDGEVKGNLHVHSRLELKGKIIGDIEAEDAIITTSLIRGDIKASNVITIDGGTTVVGDVSAKNVQVNGKIKGNLTVEERAHFEERATLVGNLISGTVIIDEGAMLKGDIAITNAQNENISVEEPEFDIEI